MKLRISMPIKYKIILKEIVLAKFKKIVHLLQDNEITESSPKALKDAKTLRQAPGPHPLSGRYFNTLPRAPHPVATPLTSPGAIVQHIKDTYIGSGLKGSIGPY